MQAIRNMNPDHDRITVVSTKMLLEMLKANRELHLKDYNAAVEGYLATARKQLAVEFDKGKRELEKAFQRTQSELQMFDPEKARDTIVFCRGIEFKLIAPRNYSAAYDQAIQMMEWETRDRVELSTTEFRCFVMNMWDWVEDFKSSTINYIRH